MDFQEFKARTVSDAVTEASIRYGVTSDRLEFEIVSEGSSGLFFGIGKRDAVIRARVKEEAPKKPVFEKKEEPKTVKPEKKPEKAVAEKKEKAPEKPAAVKAEVKEPVKKREPKFLSADEIEARAAAAAARAKENGEEEPVYEKKDREKRDRRDRRDRRGRRGDRREDRRDDRRDDRREKRERKADAEEAKKAEPVRKPSAPKPERVVLPKTPEEIEAMKKAAGDFLVSVFGCMGTEVSISMEYDEKEGCLSCLFSGDDMGILIGKRGQTLDSLQYLTSLVVNKGKSDYTRVKLDTEDYRARRADTLENLSRNIAYKVKRTHKAVSLEPMNPYERRIIHSALQNNKYVETYSEGEEPYRHVVVAPKKN